MSDFIKNDKDPYVAGLANEVVEGMEELMRTAKAAKREVKMQEPKPETYTPFMMGAASTLMVLVAALMVYSYFFKKKSAIAAVSTVAEML